MPPRKILCGCAELCKDPLKEVSASTWTRHAPFRTKPSSTFTDFVNSQSQANHAGSTRAPSAPAAKRTRVTEGREGAEPGPSKHRRTSTHSAQTLSNDEIPENIDVHTPEALEALNSSSPRSNLYESPSADTPAHLPIDIHDHGLDPLEDGHTLSEDEPSLLEEQRPNSPLHNPFLPPPGTLTEEELAVYTEPDPGSLADLVAGTDIASLPAPALPTIPPLNTTLLEAEARTPMAESTPSRIEDIRIMQEFVKALEVATLDADNIEDNARERLCNPPRELPDIDSDLDLRLSLDVFLATTSAPDDVYDAVRTAVLRCDPGSEMLSHYQVKKRVAELSGVAPIIHDMCVNTCVAFTGPFSDMETCPMCHEPRYDQQKLHSSRGNSKVPRQIFHTLPLGLQLQARRRHPEMASMMQHRDIRTQELLAELEKGEHIKVFEDVYHGSDFIEAAKDGRIAPDDTVVLLSIDGAQLYQNKASDCWIYIWVILDLVPDQRYKMKNILLGGVIPGPNKPKNLDSFLFPGLHHLAALQKEGLHTWDAAKKSVVIDHPFLAFADETRLRETLVYTQSVDVKDYIEYLRETLVYTNKYVSKE